MQYCSLQHWTLFSSPDTSTTECHFCFGPAAWFLLKVLVIALCSSPVAYWTPSNLGNSPSGVISFCLFMLSMWFSRQEYWSGLPFPLPVAHTCNYDPSVLVALRSIAYSFAELCKTLHHNKAMIYERAQPGEVFKFFSLLKTMVMFGWNGAAESGQEYLTSGKDYIDPWKTQ